MFPFTLIHSKARARGLDYLMIGGHAVNFYAEPRATLDVDLLIRKVEQSQWRVLLEEEGFKLYRDGTNFLQFSPPYGTSWRIDLMLVNDQTFGKLLADSKPVESLGLLTRIPSAEHLIALKLHAIVHGPAERFEKDFVDVVGIARNARLDPSSPGSRETFHRFGTAEFYEKFKTRIRSK